MLKILNRLIYTFNLYYMKKRTRKKFEDCLLEEIIFEIR